MPKLKSVTTYSLKTENADAVRSEARKLAAKLDRQVTASSLIDALIEKYIIKKAKKGKGNAQ